ncbi:hypothetical protein PVAND_007749 [Polypedilum vanderplanki]|uniref:CFA20 domain-containing protein n=1 Tax=Polypedilum vanderplanki TaxID=319348 RepID=A0A9J6C8C8_POLVA|nr:hypothetical protein PVAND_007749 [Polypedilum vanderplanki]
MFRNTFQKGFLSVFYSHGSKPLLIWDSKVSHGHIKRITDEDAKSLCLDIRGVNVQTCYITAPNAPCTSLGIKLPFLTIIVKNLRKNFSFEIQILDDRNQLRRFRCSNYQSKTLVTSFTTYMPIALNHGWNQLQLNLADFVRRAYGTNYMEAVRITIHANCRLRNVYFSDRLYSDEEKPQAFKFVVKEKIPYQPQPVPSHIVKAINATAPSVSTEAPKIPNETFRPTSPISHVPTDMNIILNQEIKEEEEAQNISYKEEEEIENTPQQEQNYENVIEGEE